MKTKLFVCTLFLITLIGCVPTLPPTQVQPTQTSLSPLAPTTTPTRLPTAVALTASPTTTPLNWGAIESCITTYPARPADAQLMGVVPIQPLNNTAGLDISLLNLANNTSKSLIDGYATIWEAGVSPDRRTLAFRGSNRATSKWELALVDTTGKLQKIAWSSDEPFYFQGWLNNHQIVIRQDSKYIIVDFHQNSQKNFNPGEFPDFDIYNKRQFLVVFDPLLREAIYFSFR